MWWQLLKIFEQESGLIKVVLLKRLIWQDKAEWIGGKRSEHKVAAITQAQGDRVLDRRGNSDREKEINRQDGKKKDQPPCD